MRKVGEYEYSPFGEVFVAQGDRAKHNFYLFAGREYLERLGMYDMRARLYDPRLGRFVERDPLLNHDNKEAYVYVKNNPVIYRDPSGWYRYHSLMGKAISSSCKINQGNSFIL